MAVGKDIETRGHVVGFREEIFIVLQHVERFQGFEMYVRETARVLRPGGLAVRARNGEGAQRARGRART